MRGEGKAAGGASIMFSAGVKKSTRWRRNSSMAAWQHSA